VSDIGRVGDLYVRAGDILRSRVRLQLPFVILMNDDMLDALITAGIGHCTQGFGRGNGWEGISLARVGFEKDLTVIPDDTSQAAYGLKSRLYHGIDVLPFYDHH